MHVKFHGLLFLAPYLAGRCVTPKLVGRKAGYPKSRNATQSEPGRSWRRLGFRVSPALRARRATPRRLPVSDVAAASGAIRSDAPAAASATATLLVRALVARLVGGRSAEPLFELVALNLARRAARQLAGGDEDDVFGLLVARELAPAATVDVCRLQ